MYDSLTLEGSRFFQGRHAKPSADIFWVAVSFPIMTPFQYITATIVAEYLHRV